MTEPRFPPLMSGHSIQGPDDPFDKACAMAALGCDAGLVVYNLASDKVLASLVVTPEVPLEQAMAIFPICGVGFQNALGALAPPEVAVHLEWAGGLRVNGARCGKMRVATAECEPGAGPDWIVVGLEVPLIPASDQPGDHPDQTALYEEGCVEISPVALIESWARHTLNWINRWEADGTRALHAEWRGLAHGMGEAIEHSGKSGTFLGVDEDFGMLLRDDETTHLIPLSSIREGLS